MYATKKGNIEIIQLLTAQQEQQTRASEVASNAHLHGVQAEAKAIASSISSHLNDSSSSRTNNAAQPKDAQDRKSNSR